MLKPFAATASFPGMQPTGGNQKRFLHDVHIRRNGSDSGQYVRVYAPNPQSAITQVEGATDAALQALHLAARLREAFQNTTPIIIEGYTSDGPGFLGCIETFIAGDQIAQILISSEATKCHLTAVRLERAFPHIETAKALTKKDARDMWDAMPETMREYFMDMLECVDLKQVRRLGFADKTHGYVMAGGEPNFFIIMQVSAEGKLLRHEHIECLFSVADLSSEAFK